MRVHQETGEKILRETTRSSSCAANNRFASIEAKESMLRVHLIPEMGQLLRSEVAARELEAYKAKKLRSELRLGEIMGLRWEDTDLVAGRLLVNRAVSRGRIVSPKNGRAREVPLGLDMVRALKAHRHLKGELVFPGPNGRLLHRNEMKHPLAPFAACWYGLETGGGAGN